MAANNPLVLGGAAGTSGRTGSDVRGPRDRAALDAIDLLFNGTVGVRSLDPKAHIVSEKYCFCFLRRHSQLIKQIREESTNVSDQ